MPIFRGLTDKGERRLNVLEGLVQQIGTKSGIQRALQQLGTMPDGTKWSYRVSELNKDIDIINNAYQDFANAIPSQSSSLVRDYAYTDAKTPMKVPTREGYVKYKTTIKVIGVDKTTNRRIEKYVTISHNHELSRKELEDDAIFTLDPERYRLDVRSATLVKGYKTPTRWML